MYTRLFKKGTILAVLALSSAGAFAMAVKEPKDGKKDFTVDTLPFAWQEGFASPGTSLALQEMERVAVKKDVTFVWYRIKASGFVPGAALTLWVMRDRSFLQPFDAKVGNDDMVEIQGPKGSVGQLAIALHVRDEGPAVVRSGGKPKGLLLAGFAEGHPLELALAAEGGTPRAQAKVVPLPWQAAGEGGCSATAELTTGTGSSFMITLKGFQAGEEVQVESRYKKEVITHGHTALATGEVKVPLLFGPGDNGTATVSAKGKACGVKLDYSIGRDAIVR